MLHAHLPCRFRLVNADTAAAAAPGDFMAVVIAKRIGRWKRAQQSQHGPAHGDYIRRLRGIVGQASAIAGSRKEGNSRDLKVEILGCLTVKSTAVTPAHAQHVGDRKSV